MIPIVRYPQMVSNYLPRFEKCFRRPEQFQHFAEYVTGLIVCLRHSISYMNQQFLGHRDQSVKNRFLTESPWSDLKVNRKRIRLILEKVKIINPKKCLLVIDDTLLEHERDCQMEQMTLFREKSDGRYGYGHIIVASHFICPLGHFPITFRLYYPKGRISKITLAKWLVKAAMRLGLPFKTVVLDAWYLAPELTDFLESHGKCWVSRGKANRSAFLDGRKQNIVEWLHHLAPESIAQVTVDEKPYEIFSKNIKLANHKKIKLVAVKDAKENSGWTMLFCSQLDWLPEGVIRTYNRRWKIEAFYRDAKQNLGLEDYMLRNMTWTKRHWSLVFVAYTLLQLSSLDSGLRRSLETNAVSIGSKCREAIQDIGRSFILWVARQTALGKAPHEKFDLAYLKT